MFKVLTYKDKPVEVLQDRKRSYKPFESRNPRLRSACPRCLSVSVKRRKMTGDYTCDRCGWTGTAIKKIEY